MEIPLSKGDQLKLIDTLDDNLKKEFPNQRRGDLRKWKKELIEEYKSEVNQDIDNINLKREVKELEKKYEYSLKDNQRLSKEVEAVIALNKSIQSYTIKPLNSDQSNNEATAVMLASDWHYEEEIKGESVNYKNKFNLKIADERIDRFFQKGLRLIKVLEKDIKIPNLVLALLGDFISGNIHDDLIEINQLQPIEAICEIQKKLISGINFLLQNFEGNIIIPCSSGNHSRMTKEQRVASEQGNSLEIFMYKNLAMYYENNNRVKFLIHNGYHNIVEIYNLKFRFHHGHALKFNGGVGGLTIPVNKAINEWNKAIYADYDVFGHWHTRLIGSNFISNGCLIGYSPYALKIKAQYEVPSQEFFLVDKNRGISWNARIFLN